MDMRRSTVLVDGSCRGKSSPVAAETTRIARFGKAQFATARRFATNMRDSAKRLNIPFWKPSPTETNHRGMRFSPLAAPVERHTGENFTWWPKIARFSANFPAFFERSIS
ncbi:hypothetical protein [Novosphingobium sp. B-7]|uniref:hypothetical protein n=1 Tax=Novosphingobium sp. B-7 TaxID=1298855 RepID=UPI0011D20C56|nr:hypothetical protein [Novosphingobium sp. B-7]